MAKAATTPARKAAKKTTVSKSAKKSASRPAKAPIDMTTLPPMIKRALKLTKDLEGITVESHWGYPSLKAGGKAFANVCREPGALAVHCPLELKEMLCEAAPDIYFDTDHFRNWPSILVRMDVIDDATLKGRLAEAHAARMASVKPKRARRGPVRKAK
ncbi:MAG: MmcQ/YjbR family DNA-binding protein [Hyphomonadaceae bacterium]